MRTYDTYKDSGISWLGQIPSHWELKPGFSLYHENDEKFDMLSEPTVLSLSYGNIIVKKNKDEGLVPENYSGYQVIKPDYIIIRCTDLQNDKVSLRTGIAKNHGIITGAYLGLIANDGFNALYLHYFLHDWDITKEIYRHGSGLRQVLSWNDMKRLPILVPPLVEQEAIVAYLDSATAEIDKAIAGQQRMVELLQERKQIIINQAVTQGLNPGAPMKPTNIDWLPQIPAHWQLRRFKYIGKTSKVLINPNLFKDQLFYEYSMPAFDNQKQPDVVLGENMESSKVVLSESTLLVNKLNVHKKRIWYVNNPEENSVASTEFIPFAIQEANPYFVELFLTSDQVTDYLSNNTNGATNSQKRVAPDTIYNLLIALPTQKEQHKIVQAVERQINPIKDSISRCEQKISLLTERKQILINDVVTGKIKVL